MKNSFSTARPVIGWLACLTLVLFLLLSPLACKKINVLQPQLPVITNTPGPNATNTPVLAWLDRGETPGDLPAGSVSYTFVGVNEAVVNSTLYATGLGKGDLTNLGAWSGYGSFGVSSSYCTDSACLSSTSCTSSCGASWVSSSSSGGNWGLENWTTNKYAGSGCLRFFGDMSTGSWYTVVYFLKIANSGNLLNITAFTGIDFQAYGNGGLTNKVRMDLMTNSGVPNTVATITNGSWNQHTLPFTGFSGWSGANTQISHINFSMMGQTDNWDFLVDELRFY